MTANRSALSAGTASLTGWVKGGNAEVWRAERQDGTVVAVKVLTGLRATAVSGSGAR